MTPQRPRLPRLRTALFLLPLLAFALASAHSAEPPPNVIVILADDLGYGDLGSYGSTTIATPRLDQMAREGLRFTAAYTSAPFCSPARAGLLTGRLPARAGLELLDALTTGAYAPAWPSPIAKTVAAGAGHFSARHS